MRVSPLLSKKHLFFTSKYEMVKTCYSSLLESLKGINFRVMVILDNCPPSFDDLFYPPPGGEPPEFIRTPGIGNNETFLKQLDLLERQEYSDLVFFAEDDYLYIHDLHPLLGFMNEGKENPDFVTPYDHPDYYGSEYHRYEKLYTTHGQQKWKQVGSTTCTFFTSKKTLKEAHDIMKQYPRLCDYLMFNLLTRKNPLLSWMHFRDLYALAPYSLIVNMLNLRRRTFSLWAPEPSFATHLQQGGLSPNIDWEKYLKLNSLAKIA